MALAAAFAGAVSPTVAVALPPAAPAPAAPIGEKPSPPSPPVPPVAVAEFEASVVVEVLAVALFPAVPLPPFGLADVPAAPVVPFEPVELTVPAIPGAAASASSKGDERRKILIAAHKSIGFADEARALDRGDRGIDISFM